jgi:general secretion pathway protein D
LETSSSAIRTAPSEESCIIFIQPHRRDHENGQVRITSSKEDYRTKIGADAAERFPQDVNIQAIRTSDAADAAASKEKKTFFNRLFSRDGKVKKAEPPPSLRR